MSNNRKQLFDMAKQEGYVLKSTKGSHYKFENEHGMVLIIPFHSHEITTGMTHRIEKDIERNKCSVTNKKLKREK